MEKRSVISVLAPVLAGFAMTLAAASHAVGGAGEWVSTPYSKARIISAGPDGGGPSRKTWRIGVQITLDPGWKTYWRVPGDAGVPPVFDWSKSSNVDEVRLEWPVPGRYLDEYATAIGYIGEVVFPVTVVARDPSKPVRAVLDLAYAVCRDICLPARAALALDLARNVTRESAAHGSVIAEYGKRVPVPMPTEDGLPAVSLLGEGDDTRLVIDLGTVSRTPELFVEGPEEFYFGTPEPASAGTGAVRRLIVAVDGVTAERPLAGRTVRLTVADGDRLTEHEVSIN